MEDFHTTPEQISQMRNSLKIEMMTKKNTKKQTFRYASTTISVIVFIFLVFCGIKIHFDKQSGKVPDILGYQILQVETGSMIPTFPIGSLIVNKIPNSQNDIVENEIITFYHNNDIITHRVVDIISNDDGSVTYITKGDNPQNSIDPWELSFEQIISVNKFKLPF